MEMWTLEEVKKVFKKLNIKYQGVLDGVSLKGLLELTSYKLLKFGVVDAKLAVLAQSSTLLESKEMEEYVCSLRHLPKQDDSQFLDLARSFRQNYRTPDLVKAMTAHVDGCLVSWSSGKLFSPYFVLCQSSGYGKSRLLRELALHNQGVYRVLYICLRRAENTGYPVSNRVAINFLNSLSLLEYDEVYTRIRKWFVAMLTYLSQPVQISFEQVAKMDKVAISLFKSFTEQSVQGEILQDFILPYSCSSCSSSSSTSSSTSSTSSSTTTFSSTSSELRLILAFDEAGFLLGDRIVVKDKNDTLISLFRVFR